MTATRTIEDYVNLERCIDSLEDERVALLKDAERYRFVRSADRVAISNEAARDPVAYDAAIDAAIEAAQGEK